MSREEAHRLMKQNHEASLGTIGDDGNPFVSATGYVFQNEAMYILISDLARHSKNIQKNAHVSLLIVEANAKAPVHERKRVTVQGKAERVNDKAELETLKKIYLEHFPKAGIFFSLPDFRFYRVPVQELHWIGGFGKAETFKG